MFRRFKAICVSFFMLAAIVSCSGNTQSPDVEENPVDLANQAADTYKNSLKELHALVLSDPNIESKTLEDFYTELKASMTAFGERAERLGSSDKNVYQRKFMIAAYEGAEAEVIGLTKFKDSLSRIDMSDAISIGLQEIMTLSVYGDFDQLKRVFPSQYKKLKD